MSEQTITRYSLTLPTGAKNAGMRLSEIGCWVHYEDHESALAEARRTSEYWKANHLAGNTVIDTLRAAIREKAERVKQQYEDAKKAGDFTWAARLMALHSELIAMLEEGK